MPTESLTKRRKTKLSNDYCECSKIDDCETKINLRATFAISTQDKNAFLAELQKLCDLYRI